MCSRHAARRLLCSMSTQGTPHHVHHEVQTALQTSLHLAHAANAITCNPGGRRSVHTQCACSADARTVSPAMTWACMHTCATASATCASQIVLLTSAVRGPLVPTGGMPCAAAMRLASAGCASADDAIVARRSRGAARSSPLSATWTQGPNVRRGKVRWRRSETWPIRRKHSQLCAVGPHEHHRRPAMRNVACQSLWRATVIRAVNDRWAPHSCTSTAAHYSQL